MAPQLGATIATLIVALGFAALANWQMRRPFERRWLPVVPWLGVQFLAVAVALIMIAHLVSLLTGHPFGRSYAP
jgi:multisubunit Na+/H+ antiporter MnhE subunit